MAGTEWAKGRVEVMCSENRGIVGGGGEGRQMAASQTLCGGDTGFILGEMRATGGSFCWGVWG